MGVGSDKDMMKGLGVREGLYEGLVKCVWINVGKGFRGRERV